MRSYGGQPSKPPNVMSGYNLIIDADWTLDYLRPGGVPYAIGRNYIPATATALYVLMIILLPRFMEKREAYILKWPSAFWNLFIAGELLFLFLPRTLSNLLGFSIIAGINVIPHLIREYAWGRGISNEICTSLFEEIQVNPWVYLFIWRFVFLFVEITQFI